MAATEIPRLENIIPKSNPQSLSGRIGRGTGLALCALESPDSGIESERSAVIFLDSDS
jgi:hypothetical protein